MAEIVHNDMGSVAASIQAAFKTVMAQTAPEKYQRITEFVVRLIYLEKPYRWVTAGDLPELIRRVFADDDYRDFALLLQFHFFTRWGEGTQKFSALAEAMSWGVGVEGSEASGRRPVEDLRAVPEQLRIRLSGREDARALLDANPWMVCLLLLRAYVSLVDTSKLPKTFADPAEPVVTEL